jgi:hypothetical protein
MIVLDVNLPMMAKSVEQLKRFYWAAENKRTLSFRLPSSDSLLVPGTV